MIRLSQYVIFIILNLKVIIAIIAGLNQPVVIV